MCHRIALYNRGVIICCEHPFFGLSVCCEKQPARRKEKRKEKERKKREPPDKKEKANLGDKMEGNGKKGSRHPQHPSDKWGNSPPLHYRSANKILTDFATRWRIRLTGRVAASETWATNCLASSATRLPDRTYLFTRVLHVGGRVTRSHVSCLSSRKTYCLWPPPVRAWGRAHGGRTQRESAVCGGVGPFQKTDAGERYDFAGAGLDGG